MTGFSLQRAGQTCEGRGGPLREVDPTGAKLTAPGGINQEGKGIPGPRAGVGGLQDVQRAWG